VGQRVDYDAIAPEYDARYATPRYADVALALRAWACGSPGARLLEVGCGTGYWLQVLGEDRLAIGLDSSAGMLARARTRVPSSPLVRGDAATLPLGDASVDAVLCMNAFHHFSDQPAFIAEAARVLVPGGSFCTVGLDPHRGASRWPVYDYFPGTRERDLARYPEVARVRTWLAGAGFEDCESHVVQRIRSTRTADEALASPMMQRSGTSQLALLSEEEYAAGIRRIRADGEHARAEGRTLILETELELMATTARRERH
jgi:ubiquinone/menaquinone biosynthesis C-methylase UbiE